MKETDVRGSLERGKIRASDTKRMPKKRKPGWSVTMKVQRPFSGREAYGAERKTRKWAR